MPRRLQRSTRRTSTVAQIGAPQPGVVETGIAEKLLCALGTPKRMRYGGRAMTAKPPIFDFLRSRGARMSCPFCGHEDWHGWDERITLDHAIDSGTLDRRGEAYPLTCANCGFVRLQSAHVLDDPRDTTRNQRGN